MPLVVLKLHIFRLVTFTFLAFNLSCQHGLCSVCESRGKVNWDLLSQPSIWVTLSTLDVPYTRTWVPLKITLEQEGWVD